MGEVVVLENPVLKELLTKLRDKRTGVGEFRELLEEVGMYMGYELAKFLPREKVVVETPLKVKAEGERIKDEEVVVVGILRAAVPLVIGILKVLKRAKVGLVAARRIEDENAEKHGFKMKVVTGYKALPSSGEILVIADPMLATGSTILAVLKEIECKKYKEVFILSVISTELGIKRILEAEPRAKVLTLAIDQKLNKRAYIVPGLGDAGDRTFGL